MKKTFTLLLTIISVILLTGCTINFDLPGKKDTPIEVPPVEEKKEIDPSENVATSASLADNGLLIVFAENKNDFSIEMEIKVEFYDEDGKLLKTGEQKLYGVAANAKTAGEIYDTPDKYDTYKIFVDAEKQDTYTTFNKELEVIDNNTGDEIAVKVQNNGDTTIDWISISVVYYKEDKAVGISTGMETDIKSGKSANFNVHYAYTKDYDYVDFDTYKVFVNEAYSYGY